MRLRVAVAEARKRGQDAGSSTAGWVFDGNTDYGTYRAVVRMLEDGDPAINDIVQEPSWLSGEWAGESINELLGDLVEAVPVESEGDEESVLDELSTEFESAASEAFWQEVERVARLHAGDGDADDEDDDSDDDDGFPDYDEDDLPDGDEM